MMITATGVAAVCRCVVEQQRCRSVSKVQRQQLLNKYENRYAVAVDKCQCSLAKLPSTAVVAVAVSSDRTDDELIETCSQPDQDVTKVRWCSVEDNLRSGIAGCSMIAAACFLLWPFCWLLSLTVAVTVTADCNGQSHNTFWGPSVAVTMTADVDRLNGRPPGG